MTVVLCGYSQLPLLPTCASESKTLAALTADAASLSDAMTENNRLSVLRRVQDGFLAAHSL